MRFIKLHHFKQNACHIKTHKHTYTRGIHRLKWCCVSFHRTRSCKLCRTFDFYILSWPMKVVVLSCICSCIWHTFNISLLYHKDLVFYMKGGVGRAGLWNYRRFSLYCDMRWIYSCFIKCLTPVVYVQFFLIPVNSTVITVKKKTCL